MNTDAYCVTPDGTGLLKKGFDLLEVLEIGMVLWRPITFNSYGKIEKAAPQTFPLVKEDTDPYTFRRGIVVIDYDSQGFYEPCVFSPEERPDEAKVLVEVEVLIEGSIPVHWSHMVITEVNETPSGRQITVQAMSPLILYYYFIFRETLREAYLEFYEKCFNENNELTPDEIPFDTLLTVTEYLWPKHIQKTLTRFVGRSTDSINSIDSDQFIMEFGAFDWDAEAEPREIISDDAVTFTC